MYLKICDLSDKNQKITIITMAIIALIFIMRILPYILNKNFFFTNLAKRIHYGCLFTCDADQCKNVTDKWRSSNYFINDMIKEKVPENKEQREIYQKSCILSSWGVSHYVLYMIFGIIAPTYLKTSIFIGIFFEIVEHYAWKCGDILDVLWNTVGFLTGQYIHSKIC
jgi:hypothetical protein